MGHHVRHRAVVTPVVEKDLIPPTVLDDEAYPVRMRDGETPVQTAAYSQRKLHIFRPLRGEAIRSNQGAGRSVDPIKTEGVVETIVPCKHAARQVRLIAVQARPADPAVTGGFPIQPDVGEPAIVTQFHDDVMRSVAKSRYTGMRCAAGVPFVDNCGTIDDESRAIIMPERESVIARR